MLLFNYLFTLPSLLFETIIAIVLGGVQGITEFLPISSTAHLYLVSKFLINKDIGLNTSNIIQFGTLIAIIQYFWLDLKSLFTSFIKLFRISSLKNFINDVRIWIKSNPSNTNSSTKVSDDYFNNITLAQVIIATIPIIIFALLMRNVVESLRENILNIALFLILGGIVIGISELLHKFNKRKKDHTIMSIQEVLIIGLFQSIAVFPGISRSGSTLAGALILGRNRNQSVRFSFLLSIPALGLASFYDLIKIGLEIINGKVSIFPMRHALTDSNVHLSLAALLLGFAVAYIVGLLSLKWLLRYLSRNDSRWFIFYRLILAALIIFVATGSR
jgi:undecaprenyl-diphosphatase